MEKLKEPKFMREIHRIRAELSKMTPTRYEKYLEEVRQKYADRLGHLYQNKHLMKTIRLMISSKTGKPLFGLGSRGCAAF